MFYSKQFLVYYLSVYLNHIYPWGTALLIGVNLSSNTQFSIVLDPPTSLKRGQKILVPLLERGDRKSKRYINFHSSCQTKLLC